MYFPSVSEGYNWVPDEKRIPVVQPVLEVLKTQHADNFGWALACCAWQRDSAEDVLQEAYLRVLDGRANFAGKSSPKTWFFAVIKRVAADLKRTQTRRSLLNLRLLVADSGVSAQDNGMHDAVYVHEASQQLQTALMQLSVRQREILHLVFYSEFTVEESAQTLQISVGSARTHYQRGKERLAVLLEEPSDPKPEQAQDNE